MTHDAFVFLDSSRSVPQKVQQLVIRHYADELGITVAVIGGELLGMEEHHHMLHSYLNTSEYSHYIFFSIHQFYCTSSNSYDFTSLSIPTKSAVSFHFAAEKLSITDQLSFNNIHNSLKVILISKSFSLK